MQCEASHGYEVMPAGADGRIAAADKVPCFEAEAESTAQAHIDPAPKIKDTARPKTSSHLVGHSGIHFEPPKSAVSAPD